jgi:hypothetical protein
VNQAHRCTGSTGMNLFEQLVDAALLGQQLRNDRVVGVRP